ASDACVAVSLLTCVLLILTSVHVGLLADMVRSDPRPHTMDGAESNCQTAQDRSLPGSPTPGCNVSIDLDRRSAEVIGFVGGGSTGQSHRHASELPSDLYEIRTGIARSLSLSCASARTAHQSYRKISTGRHIATQPPIRRPSRTISPT